MFHVIVADSKTVRLLETAPVGGKLDELAVFHNEVAQQHERDLVTSRPGRVVNSAAGTRQSYQPRTSARQYLTQRWLKLIGAQLQSLLASRESQAVILVAAPRMLAELRRQLPAATRALIHAQLARDLIHQPAIVLGRRLQPTIRAAARSALKSQPIYRKAPGRSSTARSAAALP